MGGTAEQSGRHQSSRTSTNPPEEVLLLRVCIGHALIEEATLNEDQVAAYLDQIGQKYGHIPGLAVFIEDPLPQL